jgi:hypothetical protein
VVSQVVGGIVRGANDPDIHHFQYPPRTVIPVLKHLAAGMIDFFSGLGIQQPFDPKMTLQFQVSPVIERVFQGLWHRLTPGHKFFEIGTVPGDVFLIDSVGPHGPPLVMIACQPALREIGKTGILIDITYRQMTVLIEYRHRTGEVLVQP